MGVVRAVQVVGCLAVLACPLVQVCRLFDAILLMLAKMDEIPYLLSAACLTLVVLIANMALFRILRGFLAGFMVRMYICMG